MNQRLTLKEMRQRNNLSGEQAAKLLHIHINTIYAREANPLSMPVKALLEMLTLYNYSLNDVELPTIDYIPPNKKT